jgi:hypothetical protein
MFRRQEFGETGIDSQARADQTMKTVTSRKITSTARRLSKTRCSRR